MLTHALEKRLVEEFDLQDVDTLGFYRAVFPSGCLEETGNQKPGKYNAMVRAIMPDDKNQYILCVHDDLEQLTNIRCNHATMNFKYPTNPSSDREYEIRAAMRREL